MEHSNECAEAPVIFSPSDTSGSASFPRHFVGACSPPPCMLSCGTFHFHFPLNTVYKMLWRHFQRMKENDGRAARNATIRVGKWFVAAQTVLILIYLLVRVEEGPPQIQPIHISG